MTVCIVCRVKPARRGSRLSLASRFCSEKCSDAHEAGLWARDPEVQRIAATCFPTPSGLRSSAVEHSTHNGEVAGSNPAAGTTTKETNTLSQTQRVRVFVTMMNEGFGFTTEIEEPDPATADGLDCVARAVVRYNEWFDAHGDDFPHTYKRIFFDTNGLPFRDYQHIVIHGGELISFEHHLDLDAYRADHGMDAGTSGER